MSRRLVIALLVAVTLTIALSDVVLIALPRTRPLPDLFGQRGLGALSGILFTSLGAAIALRRPDNGVGSIFLICGLFAATLEPAGDYAWYAVVERGGALPGGAWAVWLTDVVLPLALFPILTYLFLLFPDGRLPSSRWRPVAWFTTAALGVKIAASAFAFATVGTADLQLPNPVPFGLGIPLDFTGRILVSVVLVGPAAILCAAAFVSRFWASRGVERQQLKWVAYAAVVAVTLTVFLPPSSGRRPIEIVRQLASLIVPVAAAFAIFRYRLYDIDLLIKRTLVYGSLMAVLGFTYVISVLVSQGLLRDITGGSDIAVAGSTLLVVALFQPIRTRVQDAVDRRFYRARYDASRTIDAFSVRLRGDVDLDSVRADLIGVVRDTIHPAHASVWLRR